MIPNQEDVLPVIHLLPQPQGGAPRVRNIVAEVVEVIAQEYNAVVILGSHPVIRALGMIMKVRDDESAHLRWEKTYVVRML